VTTKPFVRASLRVESIVGFSPTGHGFVPFKNSVGASVYHAALRVREVLGRSSLIINEDAEGSYVAFKADWELNDGQRFLLGLNPNY